MNEWASKFLSPLAGMSDRNRADFDQFITEVNNDQLEHMYYNRELDADAECRPTFNQLSIERILEEAQGNITTLKAMEAIMQDRYAGFTSLHSNLLKARAAFESFDHVEGSLKLASDAFYIFSEQEATQAKQQIFLHDLKTSLNQIRHDAQRKISDYQREISAAEKDLAAAEKKLARSHEAQEKGIDYRNKLEAFELEGLLHNVRGGGKARETASGKGREGPDELAARLEKDIKEDTHSVLAAIGRRDQVLAASRRAFQKLDRDCKRAIFYTLRKIVDKEKESLETRRVVLEKFEQNVASVDIDGDMHDFIENHRMEEGALDLQARALSLLEDLAPSSSSSSNPSATPSPVNSQQQTQHQSHNFGSGSNHNNSSNSSADGKVTGRSSRSSSLRSDPESDPQQQTRKPSVLGGAISAAMSAMKPSASTPPPVPPQSSSSLPPTAPSSSFTSTAHASPSWEFAAYLSQIFYDNSDSTSPSAPVTPANPTESSVEHAEGTKNVHRRARVTAGWVQYSDVKTVGEQELMRMESNRALADGMQWLCTAVQTKKGRENFCTELNQFRSRKVELGGGFDALGVVLWKTLTYCQEQNDVHTAKIIMMLSQTFYRIRPRSASPEDNANPPPPADDDDHEHDEDTPRRGVEYREYIKEKLMGHSLWGDGNFWEQALWQCAIDQLQTVPYERPWFEMEKEARSQVVRRVHDVLFSQVMAIIHSMMELGCGQKQTREFLYRMCVVHQLSEAQRQQLLGMVLRGI